MITGFPLQTFDMRESLFGGDDQTCSTSLYPTFVLLLIIKTIIVSGVSMVRRCSQDATSSSHWD